MLKSILLSIIFCASISFAQSGSFVHPLKYKAKDKQKVTEFIKASVKETYSKAGAVDAGTLKKLEKSEMDAFKELTKAKNREILDKVIETYCASGTCLYSSLLLMYNEQLKGPSESPEL